ncbi:MAG: hypothetical protein AABX97_09110 [Candidatus Thermoplasmatota archaeon]
MARTSSRSSGFYAAAMRTFTWRKTGPNLVRASEAVVLEISGVDMIFRGDEPVVLEANASPGFRRFL